MRLWMCLAAAAVAISGCGQNTGESGAASGSSGKPRQQAWAAGSSTVFPFATRVAENVARTTGATAAKVESLGTGGGIKLFCSGTGSAYPDIANASRRMKKSEYDACLKNGVTEIIEIQIGYDGIVVANARNGAPYDLSETDILMGLAAEIPQGDGFVKNPHQTWNQVNKSLPAERILVYGPPPTSGTRDAFVELAMEGGAKKVPELTALKASDEDAFKARTHTLRNDGAWTDAGENDNAIVQTLTKTPGSLGVFGYAFLENNNDQVKAATVNGVAPSLATIADGSYPLSRSLYIYVKKANIGVIPGVKEMVEAFVSDSASGNGGYLLKRGLVPLTPEQHEAQKAIVKGLTAMAPPTS